MIIDSIYHHELKSSLESIAGSTSSLLCFSDTQLYNFSVSVNLLSTSALFSTTMYTPFLRLDRQQPAVRVWPVLTPSHPFPSKMLVLDQYSISLSDLY